MEEENDNSIPERIFAVGEYLEAVNIALKRFEVKITGEVTQVKVATSGHCYFTIKDKTDENVLDCIAWKYNYQICGVKLEEGLEVILKGNGQLYNATGRFSFIADTIELKGEGVLKKAYLELKKKLESEGVFAFERKKVLPTFPQNIGVITSKKGAVINDLLSNLGQFGFKVKMIDSRVEGQEAVKNLLGAVKEFKKQKIDVLLIMRGGGSLDSLQAFNNEALVRAILDFHCPIIAAIGHDKDVPLLALTADFACSTPTAAANTLNKTWEMAPLTISQAERVVFEGLNGRIIQIEKEITRSSGIIESWFNDFFDRYKEIASELKTYVLRIEQAILSRNKFLDNCWGKIESDFSFAFKEMVQKLIYLSQTIKAHDPENNLALGYCLARKHGKIVRKTSDLPPNTGFDLQVSDGIIKTKTI